MEKIKIYLWERMQTQRGCIDAFGLSHVYRLVDDQTTQSLSFEGRCHGINFRVTIGAEGQTIAVRVIAGRNGWDFLERVSASWQKLTADHRAGDNYN